VTEAGSAGRAADPGDLLDLACRDRVHRAHHHALLARRHGISATWPMSDPDPLLNRGRVEIRVILDSTDPPAGRLRVTPGAAHARDEQPDVCFTGWLGLLRALYLVTGGG